MILSLKGNRVVAESQNEEESVILLGLTTERRTHTKHKKHKFKKECPVCHKKYKSLKMHTTLIHKK